MNSKDLKIDVKSRIRFTWLNNSTNNILFDVERVNTLTLQIAFSIELQNMVYQIQISHNLGYIVLICKSELMIT